MGVTDLVRLVRIEAWRVLEHLDRRMQVLVTVARTAPQRDHVVVLCDHGPSHGAPFEDRQEHSSGRRPQGAQGEASARAPTRVHARSARVDGDAGQGDLVALGPGNPGLIHAREPERAVREQIDKRRPRLLSRLAATGRVGFVAVLGRGPGPSVVGADGDRLLSQDFVSWLEPLARHVEHAARAPLRSSTMPSTSVVDVNSAVDPATSEGPAFEVLVGSRGGLGGWQGPGLLLAHSHLVGAVTGSIRGSEELREALVSMLPTLGHRTLVPPATASAHS